MDGVKVALGSRLNDGGGCAKKDWRALVQCN